MCDGKILRCRCERVLELRRRHFPGLRGVDILRCLQCGFVLRDHGPLGGERALSGGPLFFFGRSNVVGSVLGLSLGKILGVHRAHWLGSVFCLRSGPLRHWLGLDLVVAVQRMRGWAVRQLGGALAFGLHGGLWSGHVLNRGL